MQKKYDATISHSTIIRAMGNCFECAKKGISHGENPFGACIIHQGNVISCEYDHAVSKNNPTAHAEVEAICAALNSLNRCSFEGNTLLVTTCEPCPICVTAAKLVGVSHIFYGMSIATGKKRGYLKNSFSSTLCAEMLGGGIKIINYEEMFSTEGLVDFWETHNKESI
ncbi:nucleoside deaminase [Aeromonas veronii]|uniref:nucleoside deaminase n=1 Tax=Aeromonas veronii TaxID=654 RepID=UPI001116366B|nr:nucleoside deaminase [Aeromonas veronii]TNI04360.1 hypothetical protein CF135_15785 [Aeromonas veronii]HDO1312620.1 nucleoside deaminase [Aeromonas veronii]